MKGNAQPLDDTMLEFCEEATSNKYGESPKSIVGSATSQINPMMEKSLVGDECQYLSSWLSSADKFTSQVISIVPPLFYVPQIKYTVVTKDDIKEFLEMDEINVSILHIYQL